MTHILKLNLQEAQILKRPSSVCKTPYVADIRLENDETTQGHTPALGCCGLSDKDSYVMVSKIENKKGLCSHRVELAKIVNESHTTYVGIQPKLAEELVNQCFIKKCFTRISPIHFEREKTFLHSRFDFAGIDENNQQFILEVKNVPLADYEDCTTKERKKYDFSKRDYNSKVAYFPDGYRKSKKTTVSPRALKHIQELEQLKLEQNIRTIICYVIQRDDVSTFQPSIIDPIYREAVIQAHKNGVEIMAVQIKWTNEGNAIYIRDDLPVNI